MDPKIVDPGNSRSTIMASGRDVRRPLGGHAHRLWGQTRWGRLLKKIGLANEPHHK